jgi:hypothetical protein
MLLLILNSCFLPWEGITIPKVTPTPDVISYCKLINIPLVKERNLSGRSSSPVPIRKKSIGGKENDSPNRSRRNSEELSNSHVTSKLAKQVSTAKISRVGSIRNSPIVGRKKSISPTP